MDSYSILDLAPIAEGSDAAAALAASVSLARLAEGLGYRRYWLAEHHNMPGIASSATAVVIGHIAARTSHIRLGAGGIMLPNHAPLTVAEAFGTLATLYPGRIDLGLGRAPGGDGPTARALRRYMGAADRFAEDVMELMAYLAPPRPEAEVRAIPGEGTAVPVTILGSSLYGAQLAAHLGLPFAFAAHFAPAALEEALAIYRARFRPSAACPQPRVVLAMGAVLADTDAEARFLRSSQMLAFARLRTGRPGPLPAPVADLTAHVPPRILSMVEAQLSVAAVGAPTTARAQFAAILERYRPDELILTGNIHDCAAREHSFALAAGVLSDLVTPARAA
ncbi:MAG: LLM class flavin-dependent oxidoreductase [Rhodobacteraceae bacterium]|nr:LLM class flavin-dependent oxidoreductase [Paracoccaceae bacterium]